MTLADQLRRAADWIEQSGLPDPDEAIANNHEVCLRWWASRIHVWIYIDRRDPIWIYTYHSQPARSTEELTRDEAVARIKGDG